MKFFIYRLRCACGDPTRSIYSQLRISDSSNGFHLTDTLREEKCNEASPIPNPLFPSAASTSLLLIFLMRPGRSPNPNALFHLSVPIISRYVRRTATSLWDLYPCICSYWVNLIAAAA